MPPEHRNIYSAQLATLITGATGFLGSEIFNQSGVTDWVKMDPAELKCKSKIIHLSADVSGSPDSLSTNVTIDSEIIEVAKNTGSLLIYASGNHLYPKAIDCNIYDELKPVGFYAFSKFIGEQLIHQEEHLFAQIVRLADIFGPNQRHGNLFKAIEQSLLSDKELIQLDAGLKRRNYIHVRDAAKSLLWLAQRQPNFASQRIETLNVGYSDAFTVAEILLKVSRLSNLKIQHKRISEDLSWKDSRTMVVSPFPQGVFEFDNFESALTSYVNEAITNRKANK